MSNARLHSGVSFAKSERFLNAKNIIEWIHVLLTARSEGELGFPF